VSSSEDVIMQGGGSNNNSMIGVTAQMGKITLNIREELEGGEKEYNRYMERRFHRIFIDSSTNA
jgi:hypothetical protein